MLANLLLKIDAGYLLISMSLLHRLFVTVGLHRILLRPDRNSELCRPKNPLLRKIKKIKVLRKQGRGIGKTAKKLPNPRSTQNWVVDILPAIERTEILDGSSQPERPLSSYCRSPSVSSLPRPDRDYNNAKNLIVAVI